MLGGPETLSGSTFVFHCNLLSTVSARRPYGLRACDHTGRSPEPATLSDLFALEDITLIKCMNKLFLNLPFKFLIR